MLGVDPGLIAVITAAMVVGGVIKGVLGLALPIVVIAILLHFLPPMSTIAVVVLPILVTNLWLATRSGNLMQPLRRFWLMTLCFLVFLFVGARLVVELDTQVLFGVLGTCVAAFSALNLLKPPPHPLSPGTERWVGPLAGVLGGLLGGVATVWGPPMMMFLVMLKLDKDAWIRAVGMIWFSGAVPLTIAYWHNGVLNPDNVWLSAYACVPGMVGIWIGEAIRNKVDQETFRKALLVVLFLIGLNLIRRAVF